MARKPKPVCVLALLAVAFASGCGGSSTLSKQELSKKADAICREVRVAYAEKLGPNPNLPPAIAAYDAGVLRLSQPFERKLRDLDPPKSEATTWKRYLAARRVVNGLTVREERAMRSGDQKAIQAVQADQQAAAQKRGALASKLGLKVCGNQKDVPNLLGPPKPVGPPPSSVSYVKPKDTVDDAVATFTKIKTCDQLHAFQDSDDDPLPEAGCKGLLPALAGFRVIGKDDLGPIGVVDFVAASGYGTLVLVEDAKDGRFKFSAAVANEGGAVHPAPHVNDAAKNVNAMLTALRAGDGAAFHRVISENSTLYTKPIATVAKLENPTGSGPRFVKDLKADRTAKPEVLGIDSTFGFFALEANGHHYVVIAAKGPTGYKFQGFYPQPAG